MRKRVMMGLTLNLGNFESARIDVMAEGDAGPDESPEELANRLAVECDADLRRIGGVYMSAIEEIKDEIGA